MADQAVNKMIDKAAETAKDEVKALKSAEAAFAAASEELTKPIAKAIDAVVAPAPAKASARKAPAKARRAKPAARTAKPAKAAPKRKIATRNTNKQAPVRKAAAVMNQGVKTMTKNTNRAADMFGAERFQTVFGDINERAQAATERSQKMVEEMTDLTRGNVEAMVASSKVAQKGFETLSQDAAEFGRKSFEEASATLKSFTEVKSATDFFRLQGDYTRSAFDAAIAQSARMSEQMMKIAGDVAEPINSRYTVAAERVKTLVAA